jgi:hypothetical protein
MSAAAEAATPSHTATTMGVFRIIMGTGGFKHRPARQTSVDLIQNSLNTLDLATRESKFING